MGLFTGVNDFFRGAFGEDDEEKKRRKQKEAQAAQRQQPQKTQPNPPTIDKPQTNINQFFGKKNTPTPIEVIKKAVTPTKPVEKPVAPAPRVALPDQEFKAFTAEKKVRKFLPDQVNINVDSSYSTNKDKFVADFDKLNPDVRKVYYEKIVEQAKSGDKAAVNAYNAIQETKRTPKDSKLENLADAASVPGRSIVRVATGVPQGISGIVDLFTPGEGTSRTSKFLDKVAKTQDESAKEAGVGTAYKVLNIPTEIASYFIPSTLAVKVASKFPKGAKLTEEVIEKVAKFTDDAGEAGKVRKFLANRMRQNFTLDEALEEALISGRYMGQNTARGGDTSAASVATDVAAGVGGGLLFPTKAVKQVLNGDNQTDEAVGAAVASSAEYADNAISKNADTVVDTEKAIIDMTDDELESLAKDVEAPAFDRTKYKEELDRRAQSAPGDTPLDTVPAYQQKRAIQDVIDKETNEFNDYITENPNLTLQEVEAARDAVQDKIIKLTNDLKESRYGTEAALESQAKATDEAVQGQQAVNAEVAAQQAAQNTPNPANVVETSPIAGSPEIAANNAYTGKTTEDIVFGNQPKYEEKGRLSLPQLFSPDRVIRENITRPIAEKIDEGINALNTSGGRVRQGIGRLFGGFSREAGTTAAEQTAKMQLRGGVETGKLYRDSIADLSKGMSKDSTEKVWATLDPEFAARKGITPSELSPVEQVLQDKLKTIIDNTTAENLRRGLITPEQAASGNYIKRSYTIYDGNTDVGVFEQGFRTELMGQYKGRKEVSNEMVEEAITDPTYLVGKKSAESQAMWAMQDYGNHLTKSGITSDVPKAGYTQLPDSKVFGESAGKFVPRAVAEDFTGFQYTNAMTSAFNDLITAYDRLGIRQAKKQLLTVFNPAVRLGNQVSNRVIFSQLNGINPAQFNKAMFDAKNMIKTNHPIYREAVEQGLTGIDITQADFFAKRISDGAGDPNIAKKASDWVKTSYSGADDQSRIAAYKVYRDRGYSPEEAARTVQRGFQDYKSVGFFYDMAAKMPLIGNSFVRFVADSMRIAKNAAVDHPLRTTGTIVLWGTLVNAMSVATGESEAGKAGDSIETKAMNLVTGSNKSEEQKQRESRFGAPKLPFTDISTTVQTPWGEVNAARFMPWYQLSGINDDAAGGVGKYLPISQSPVIWKDGKPEFNGAGFNDPLLGQFAQMAFDKDFRNRSIQDPKNTGQFELDPLSTGDKMKNLARWFGVNNAPLGKEIDQTVSAVMGVPDLYGKERSIPQALLRDVGLKVETYGDKQQRDAVSRQAWQDEIAQIDKDLEGMAPSAQEAYKRLTGYQKLRETKPNEFDPTKDRQVKAPMYNFSEDKWKDYATHPELYQLMVDHKVRDSQPKPDGKPGTPLPPEFDPRISESFRKQLIQNKMVVPGDDAELDQRMYSSLEWDYYQTLKDAYKEKAKEYYPENGDDFTDELVVHQDAKFPTKPDILKQYGAQYGLFTDGKAEKPEFTDALKAAKEAYNKETLNWTNTERKARGVPAIDWEMWNNPTFGYDETPSGMGFGEGGGGRGSASYDPLAGVNTLGELTNYTGSVKRYDPITTAAMPQLAQLFARLQAGGGGGGRKKPPIGASSSGL